MHSRMLSYRPGIQTWAHFDHDGTFTIETRQDPEVVTAILERNKALQNHDDRGYTHSKDMARVASIPCSVQLEWMKRYGITSVYDEEYWPLIRRLLNSSDWRHLRTSPLRI